MKENYESWESLLADLVGGDGSKSWIFRGTAEFAHQPFNSLERALWKSGAPPESWRAVESRSVGYFKERARAFLQNPPDDNDLIAWLSLMQHYGTPTRLTDWTFSSFVAIYFAYESITSDDGEAALWMLNARLCREMIGLSYLPEADHLGIVGSTDEDLELKENRLLRLFIQNEYSWPLPISILRPDKRMTAQQGCFVTNGKLLKVGETTTKELFMKTESLKKAIEKLRPDLGELATIRPGPLRLILVPEPNGEPGTWTWENYYHQPANLVRKVKLPYAWRAKVLDSLATMNITGDTLFPGLDGAGKAARSFIRYAVEKDRERS